MCERLDGMPLALELAAAWLRTLTPGEIESGLDDRFALLVRGSRGAAERQQTLAASIRWSHDLLDEPERVVFRSLAVFAGGFDLAAARAVCPAAAACWTRSGGWSTSPWWSPSIATAGRATGCWSRSASTPPVAWPKPATPAVRDRHLDHYLALVEDAEPLLDEDKDLWRARVGERTTICAPRWIGALRPMTRSAGVGSPPGCRGCGTSAATAMSASRCCGGPSCARPTTVRCCRRGC